MKKLFYSLIFFLLLFQSCNKEKDIIEPYIPPVCNEVYTKKMSPFELTGFYPSYRLSSLPVYTIRWNLLTRLIYAFAIPRPDGTLYTGDLLYASSIVQEAHKNGVEILFSIGGGAGSGDFAEAISTPAKRKTLIQGILNFLGNNCFDGVDIDYEIFQNSGAETDLTLFMKELNLQLKALDYTITIDVYPSNWSGKHVENAVETYVDQVYVMCYNFSGSWSAPGPHSSFEQSIGTGSDVNSTGLAYWKNYRGWPKSKLVLGVPFYGRDFDNNATAITYNNIYAIDTMAAYVSQWNNIYYDGLDAIKMKAEYIKTNSFPGMMVWEIAQDVLVPQHSLLVAMDSVLNK
ncbi:MAG: glycosyl hydrolase family 18 protein [Cyclobacteriaceae bacterium]|nr:glycosyl hydrolase family 18 protein [Cyclobacteriaceae bacterium]